MKKKAIQTGLTTRAQRKQIRLDKAVKRYAKALKRDGNRARYY